MSVRGPQAADMNSVSLGGHPHACMDPWCLISLRDGACLFGFATRHNGTGGSSWMRSSPVAQLDEARGRARTASGRLYELGRRTEPGHLQDPEAWAAFRLLIETPGTPMRKRKCWAPGWPPARWHAGSVCSRRLVITTRSVGFWPPTPRLTELAGPVSCADAGVLGFGRIRLTTADVLHWAMSLNRSSAASGVARDVALEPN